MSISSLIIGDSGTGKTTSLRNFSPQDVLLIQSVRKPLPFRSKDWTSFSAGNPTGNVFITDRSDEIMTIMLKTRRKIIVLDDFQYILANEFMRRSEERGFDKFTDIGRHAWDVITTANNLPADVRVYILGHTQADDFGRVKVKTIGKLLDEKIVIEGMFSIVLRTVVSDGRYMFSTRNNGNDTVKTPIGLFETDVIENDLAAVDQAITAYYQPQAAA